MPVLFVYGRLPFDSDDCCEKFTILYPDPDSRVILMYDTVYEYACGE